MTLEPIGDIATVSLSEGSAIPDSGVSRWEFEQDVADSWGSNDGTDNTSAGYTTDAAVGNYAKSFDGDNDYVSFGDVSVFHSPPFSIAFWMRTTTSNSDWDGDDRPWTKVNSGGGFDGWFFLGDLIDGDGGIVMQINGDSDAGVRVSSTTAVNDGSYHHIVGTFSNTESEMKLYVDGDREDTNTSASPGDISNPAPLTAGSRDAGADSFFEGDLDDGRFYDKVLSDTEVSNLYSTGSISG